MKNEEMQAMAKLIGQPLAEILMIFTEVVDALREQPGFDDDRFVKSIQALLSREGLSEMKRETLLSFLDNSK